MKFKLVLILAFSLIALCVGEPECGADQCKDLWTAKKCNKVKHCIAEEWSRIQPTGVRDNICTTCLEMVKEARDVLQSNETREELKEVLEGSCALLTYKPAVKICDKIVDELIPELVAVLSSQMDPEAVCSVAKLCNNELFWTAHRNSKECVHCAAFTQSADKEMESITLEEFRDGVLGVCRTAGSFSDACSQIGMEFAGVFYGTAKTVLKSKPCEVTALCPSGSESEPLDSDTKVTVKRQMCPLCKTVMQSVRERFLRVRSAEEFGRKMSEACERMSFSNNTCSAVSSRSFYEKLKNSDGLPDLFCSVTFCVEKPAEEFPIWPLLPVQLGPFNSELDALELLENVETFFPPVKEEEKKAPRPEISFGDPIENPLFFAPSLYLGESQECKTCKIVIDTLLRKKELDLSEVCNEVENVKKCKRFVKKFSPILEKVMADSLLSKKMCTQLVPNCPVEEEAETSPRTCEFCLNVMKVLKHGDSYFWGRALEDKCNDIHENSQDKCKNLSSLFVSFPTLFRNSTSEAEACKVLSLCEPSPAELHKPDDAGEKGRSTCEDCMLAVQTLADFLESNKSNELISELLDSMCSLVRKDKKDKCEELVRVVGVMGLKKIVESFTPGEVCGRVHLCGRRADLMEAPAKTSPPAEVQGLEERIQCKFCVMAMKMALDELQDNKTEDAIRKTLDKLCGYFPEETRDACKNLVNEYSDEIIDMIIADFDAKEICTYLKICPVHRLIENSISKEVSSFDVETNELRDRDWSQNGDEFVVGEFRPRIGIVELDAPKEEDFRRFRKVVQECALCEAVVGVISSHQKMLTKEYDFASNAHVISSIVPADKRKECMALVISYGPSIVNLIVDKRADPNEVCVLLDLCDAKMQAKVNQPVSVSEDKVPSNEKNDCMLGPVFWCANAENADKCGTFLHCQETVWKSWKSPPTRANLH